MYIDVQYCSAVKIDVLMFCFFFLVKIPWKADKALPTLIPTFILSNILANRTHSGNAQIQNMLIKYLIFGNMVLAFSTNFRPI